MALALDDRKHRTAPIAIAREATLTYVATKHIEAIEEKARQSFARVLKHLVDTKYATNQSKAGKALGVSQGHISAMIRGDRGPGLKTLLLMRLETGKSVDEMLGYEADPTQDLSNRLVASVELEVGRMRRDLDALRQQVAAPAATPPDPHAVIAAPESAINPQTDVRALRRRKRAASKS